MKHKILKKKLYFIDTSVAGQMPSTDVLNALLFQHCTSDVFFWLWHRNWFVPSCSLVQKKNLMELDLEIAMATSE